MEGADVYQIAKNCRTSVEMIEKYYASHLKNSLDASAINIRGKKAKKNEPRQREGRLVLGTQAQRQNRSFKSTRRYSAPPSHSKLHLYHRARAGK